MRVINIEEDNNKSRKKTKENHNEFSNRQN